MKHLYELDPYTKTFSATVTGCTQAKQGYEVTLDQTAFYPEGGGQPYDLGTIGNVHVTAVHRRNQDIIHTCDGPLPVGQQVDCSIVWSRRFDLMQQHSGEHIVSGIAHQNYGCENVGFHMGSDTITIDFDRPLTKEQIQEIEQQANQYIWEDHPVEITYPSPEALSVLSYRSKKELSGEVRIVSFPGADTCACCGTHVSSSGQVGLVKLLSCQTFRNGVRIELVCGQRAVTYLSNIYQQNHTISTQLSAKPLETAQAVTRLLDETQQLKAKIATLEEQIFQQLAQQYVGSTNPLLFVEGVSPDGLRHLCAKVTSLCSGRCACFSGSDQTGYQYVIGEPNGNLRPLCTQLNQTLSGRGGGKPDFVQGAVSATRGEIESFFAAL